MEPINPSHVYTTLMMAAPVVIKTCFQAVEANTHNKISLTLAFGVWIMNHFVSRWVFPPRGHLEDKTWRALVFYLTATIPYYLSFAMLIPASYGWIGCPFVITIVIGGLVGSTSMATCYKVYLSSSSQVPQGDLEYGGRRKETRLLYLKSHISG
ncbi:hypothetical protein M8C21_024731 [Ambrosia artemisiifolia]|uniref:Uncharacterized protein n=1 Tax=Ambrosia artemisiifolia TaxID=4212 RepID=A0AAD5GVY1_AMBAR|nr:hypothetical protein M8C21_024731 [Ambrosia artemisiifolia]